MIFRKLARDERPHHSWMRIITVRCAGDREARREADVVAQGVVLARRDAIDLAEDHVLDFGRPTAVGDAHEVAFLRDVLLVVPVANVDIVDEHLAVAQALGQAQFAGDGQILVHPGPPGVGCTRGRMIWD